MAAMTPAEEYTAWLAEQAAQQATVPNPCPTASMRKLQIQWSKPNDARDLLKSRNPVSINSVVGGEWSVPKTAAAGVIVYVHGAIRIGSVRSYRPLTSRLCAAASCCVLAVEYRRPPEVHFPAPLNDTLTAMRWLVRRGHPMSTIVLAADSFGAMPALAATLRLRDAGEAVPRGLYLLCPDTDYSNRDYLQEMPRQRNPSKCVWDQALNRYFSNPRYPCTGPEASPGLQSLANLPPILMHESRLRPLTHALQLRDRLLAEPTADFTFQDWPDVPHIWPFYGDAFTYGAEAITAAGDWIKERLSG